MPFHVRHLDGDLLCFVHRGSGLLETEFGPLAYREGDWVYVPKACTWRQLPEGETTLLMIEATDEFRVPPPGSSAGTFRLIHPRPPFLSPRPSTTTAARNTKSG